MSTTETQAQARLAYKHLVSDWEWNQLVGRLMLDEGWDRPYVERVQDAALGFVKYMAEHPDRHSSPSPIIDKGWHNLILHTRLYRRLCSTLGDGRFLDHDPNDVTLVNFDRDAVPRTVKAMRAAGYAIEPDLWPPSDNCQHSPSGPPPPPSPCSGPNGD